MWEDKDTAEFIEDVDVQSEQLVLNRLEETLKNRNQAAEVLHDCMRWVCDGDFKQFLKRESHTSMMMFTRNVTLFCAFIILLGLPFTAYPVLIAGLSVFMVLAAWFYTGTFRKDKYKEYLRAMENYRDKALTFYDLRDMCQVLVGQASKAGYSEEAEQLIKQYNAPCLYEVVQTPAEPVKMNPILLYFLLLH